MSIHADDEFNLRLALVSELDDVAPSDGLADLVIARYRKGRRRRLVGVFGLFVVFAGIGVPAGLAGTSGGTPARSGSGQVMLRLGSYTLTLPARYHLSDAKAAPCAAAAAATGAAVGGQPRQEVAAAASGVCVLMFLAPSFSPAPADPGRVGLGPAEPGRAGPGVPGGASQVTVGRYRAWLAPAGYLPAGDGAVLFVEVGGQAGDLVISATGLSRPALVSLASAGLSAA